MSKRKMDKCPFCGGDAQYIAVTKKGGYCECIECGASNPGAGSYTSYDLAIRRWNRRAPEPKVSR